MGGRWREGGREGEREEKEGEEEGRREGEKEESNRGRKGGLVYCATEGGASIVILEDKP